MARPTRDDAHLVLQLANWYTASGVAEAANWVRSDEFVRDFPSFESRYPDGSEGRLRVNRILAYHETMATLWKHGLISEELVFDWAWVPGLWDLVNEIAAGMREKSGVAALWENFEAMAERQRAIAARPARKAAKRAPATRTSKARARATTTSKARPGTTTRRTRS